MNKIDINSIVDNITLDIIRNKYNDSIFKIIPKLVDKYMMCHRDSVDYRAIIWLLDDCLKEHNYKLISDSFISFYIEKNVYFC